jgi:prophage regulatory protein
MKIICSRQVEKKVGFTRVHIWRLEKRNLFPKRFRISERRIVWDEDEIDAWLEARKSERDAV